MFATAPATARPARSSRGREMMRTTRPPVVDGLSLALQAASSDTSTYTTETIHASYAIVPDFFNSLLVAAVGGKKSFAVMPRETISRRELLSGSMAAGAAVVLRG